MHESALSPAPAPRSLPSDLHFLLGCVFGALGLPRLLGPLGARFSCPAPDRPVVLLLRPFRDARRSLFSHHWVAPALWPFGQPVFPVDANCSLWSERAGYVLPGRPAWKRNAFGFDRVLHDEDWLAEVSALAARARLIVVDVSALSTNIRAELTELESTGVLARTLCIRERSAQVSAGSALGARIAALVADAIPYALDAPSLYTFWQELVLRSSTLLHLDASRSPHPTPPRRFFLEPAHLLPMLQRGSLRP